MSALGQKQTCAMHQPMSALPLIATVKADMYPANGQSAFPPGWLLMSALSACGGGFGIFDQKIFVRYLQVCVEPMGPVHPPPEGGPWGKIIRALLTGKTPSESSRGFC